ncbi:sugar transferase [Paenibacillus methanolicus]|uniref:Lipopolysaccharide/colanic/teichoic acid biosynthesis glycosyltransferase n=1 Tax=Paenibacillus methanolicus TaxID=582686 RepID=A0A5S5C8D3_9BACL|nr:sugar transferase [Paenibacillus methanolicus]TYP75661.1 lipopolysaccharide/colanic/teichoic acid biosynthesis glycosyltransferase [Paenibacillus methanolicus]
MYEKYLKRAIDVALCILMTPIIIPVIGVCALFVILEDRGPAFYCGERLGKKGDIFKMFKLRSMKVDAPDIRNSDGTTYNSENDPRMTKVGRILRKTSLDELPQFINVLIGDMSFVGPRPDLPEHVNYYQNDEVRRLDVLPGISGYNQAYFRNNIEWKERIKNDIYYVDNISFKFDVKICMVTIINIIRRKGVYSSRSIQSDGKGMKQNVQADQ